MKPITLHPSSLLVGVALAGLAFFTMAQTPQPINPSLARPSSPGFVRAQDMVRITEGTPYVVPPNKWLVITALGDRSFEVNCPYGQPQNILRVNGVLELSTSREEISAYGYALASNMHEIPRGFAIPAGSVVEVANTGPIYCNPTSTPCCTYPSDAQAWGYLSDS